MGNRILFGNNKGTSKVLFKKSNLRRILLISIIAFIILFSFSSAQEWFNGDSGQNEKHITSSSGNKIILGSFTKLQATIDYDDNYPVKIISCDEDKCIVSYNPDDLDEQKLIDSVNSDEKISQENKDKIFTEKKVPIKDYQKYSINYNITYEGKKVIKNESYKVYDDLSYDYTKPFTMELTKGTYTFGFSSTTITVTDFGVGVFQNTTYDSNINGVRLANNSDYGMLNLWLFNDTDGDNDVLNEKTGIYDLPDANSALVIEDDNCFYNKCYLSDDSNDYYGYSLGNFQINDYANFTAFCWFKPVQIESTYDMYCGDNDAFYLNYNSGLNINTKDGSGYDSISIRSNGFDNTTWFFIWMWTKLNDSGWYYCYSENGSSQDTCASFDGTFDSNDRWEFGSRQGSGAVRAYFQGGGMWKNVTLTAESREIIYNNLVQFDKNPSSWEYDIQGNYTTPVYHISNYTSQVTNSGMNISTPAGTNITQQVRTSNSFIMDFDYNEEDLTLIDGGDSVIDNFPTVIPYTIKINKANTLYKIINKSYLYIDGGSTPTLLKTYYPDVYNISDNNYSNFVAVAKIMQNSTSSFSDSDNNRIGITIHSQVGTDNSWGFLWAGGARGVSILEENIAWRATSSANNLPLDEWWWIKVQVNGTRVHGKTWEDGEDEQDAWNVSSIAMGLNYLEYKDIGLYCKQVDCIIDEFRICNMSDLDCQGWSYTEESSSTDLDYPANSVNGTFAQFKYNFYTENSSNTPVLYGYNYTVANLTAGGEEPPVDTTPPIINCSLNKSIDAIYQYDVINVTCNATDNSNNLTSYSIGANNTGIYIQYNFSFNISGQVEFSQNITIAEASGTVINFSGKAIDNSSNYAVNDTLVIVAETLPAIYKIDTLINVRKEVAFRIQKQGYLKIFK